MQGRTDHALRDMYMSVALNSLKRFPIKRFDRDSKYIAGNIQYTNRTVRQIAYELLSPISQAN